MRKSPVCCRQRTKRRLPGKTVQVVPHITGEIQEWIERVAMNPVAGTEEPVDVCVIELGGTIGDIESMPFIEALGHFSYCADLDKLGDLLHVTRELNNENEEIRTTSTWVLGTVSQNNALVQNQVTQ
ncbi:hypothetical protein PVAP13_4KG175600 [Panicum virgatum]|uniref:CTP synthase N-terminal domain-containing protein n=1 Tax=Panicum virgatum TaxID=38727 RepID=A0A8T0TEH6_PANVG|nr:hypothetical protein PVAP13_4KG175600 [Panicum virgatum]